MQFADVIGAGLRTKTYTHTCIDAPGSSVWRQGGLGGIVCGGGVGWGTV